MWALARRGFAAEAAAALGAPRERAWIQGAPGFETTYALTRAALVQALAPAERARPFGEDAELERRALDHAKDVLVAAAARAARLSSPVPEELELEDLDALLEEGRRPSLSVFAPSAREQAEAAAADDVVARFLEEATPEDRDLAARRFAQGFTAEALAAELDTSPTGIRAHEAKLRRKLQSKLQTALGEANVGPADVDAHLAGRGLGLLPPAVTWERLRRDVRTSVFEEEPPSFRSRLPWGLGALALGLAGAGLMAAGILPGPADDPVVVPALELRCQPACVAGAEATVAVRAPSELTRVAVYRVKGGRAEALLTGPSGGTARLPMGTSTRAMPLSRSIRLPPDLDASDVVVAVLSEAHLSGADAENVALGARLDGAVTATVAPTRTATTP